MIRTFIVTLPLVAACTTHIAPYTAKHREFDPGIYADTTHRRAPGSLYAQGARGLLDDDRARAVGDLVVVQIDETDSAQHDSSTKMGKKSSHSLNMSGGIVDALQKVMPAVQLQSLLGLDSGSDFNGSGAVKRQGKLTASLPMRVRAVLPNDDLFIEGTKVVMVGNEEHHLYLSGIVRQVDIKADGSIPSSRIADAEIEYTGRGDISDYQRPGWLTRILNKVSPF